MRTLRSQAGLSLLEWMIALLIYSVISSVAILSMRHPLARTELLQAARQIEADLDDSRTSAISQETSRTVRFAPWDPTYSVWKGTKKTRVVRLPYGIDYKEGYVRLNIPDVDFDSDGATKSGGRIVLENQYGDTVTVMVYPITGQIAVYQS